MFHRPIFRDKEQGTRAYIAFGSIAIYWGPIELAIEFHILMLRNKLKYGVSKDRKKWDIPFPLAFGKKVDELKLHLKSRPGLKDAANYLSPILAECKALHKVRVAVVHSLCNGTNLAGNVMFLLSDQKNSRMSRSIEYSIDELETAAEKMLEIAEKLDRAREPRLMFLSSGKY
jgi:hypothetical protein